MVSKLSHLYLLEISNQTARSNDYVFDAEFLPWPKHSVLHDAVAESAIKVDFQSNNTSILVKLTNRNEFIDFRVRCSRLIREWQRESWFMRNSIKQASSSETIILTLLRWK